MTQKLFKVRLNPLEVQDLIEKNIYEELVFSDAYDLGNGKYILITVYDKYYMRTGSNTGLVIVCENTKENTIVKVTSTGSGSELLGIDWGSGESFIKKVKEIISEYII